MFYVSRRLRLLALALAASVIGLASSPAAAQDPDNCTGTCSAWTRPASNDFCGSTPRWVRTCQRGSAPAFSVVQQTCSATTPGTCASQSFLPAGGCKGYCDPWYWQSTGSGCENWRRLCHSVTGGLWEDTCSGGYPGTCAGCFCEYGADWTRAAIDPASTYCGYKVCGADFRHYDCRVGGWQYLGTTCPVTGDQPADMCPSRTATGPFPFPTAARSVRAINYFPREHYQGRMWTHWDVQTLRQDLDQLRTMNVNAVRVILNQDALGDSFPAASAYKVDRLLCELNRRGMKAVFLLGLRNTGFPCTGGLTTQQNTFISAVASRYRNDPTVLMWEITNEPLCNGQWNALDATVQERIRLGLVYLKSWDPNHPVSFALLQDQVDDLVPNLLSTIDVFNFHLYDPNPFQFPGQGALGFPDNYLQKAKQVAGSKPIFLGEFGCEAFPWGAGSGGQQSRYCDAGSGGGVGTLAQLETAQATYFNRIYDKAVQQGFAGLAPWMAYEAAPFDPADASQNIEYAAWPSFGFVRPDRTLKPAGTALRTKYQ